LIARRIICTVTKDEIVERGQRIGMIKFGSRTELTIAKFLDPQVKVIVGQTVRGAADIIAILGNPIHTHAKDGGAELEPIVPRETPA
jgi:phosphatidylserine decarboxylase